MKVTKKEARELLSICASARKWNFRNSSGIIKAVSVANRDIKRPEVAAILNGREMLWPPGACNMGMTMWVQCRLWFPL